jgi:hypothetical protein
MSNTTSVKRPNMLRRDATGRTRSASQSAATTSQVNSISSGVPANICITRPVESEPIPETLDWELWLGPAPWRPYHSTYLPGNWRRWWDFGTGALGDMACHICNVAFWALDLRDPIAVDAEVSAVHKESFPQWSIIVWDVPAPRTSAGREVPLVRRGQETGPGLGGRSDRVQRVMSSDRYPMMFKVHILPV